MVTTQGPICLESRPKKLPKKGGRARKAEIRPYLKDDIDRKKSTLFFAILLESIITRWAGVPKVY